MTKTSVISAKIDPKLKNNVEQIFKKDVKPMQRCGKGLSEFKNIFEKLKRQKLKRAINSSESIK
jgi:hypothetical protein